MKLKLKKHDRNCSLLIIAVVLALAGCQSSSVAVTTPSSLSPSSKKEDFTTAQDALVKEDQPLKAFLVAERLSEQQQNMSAFATQFSVFVGRDLITRKLADQGRRGSEPDKSIDIDVLTPVDAVEEIVSAARLHKVVIVNETHDSQRQRAFIYSVGKALRRTGFTHVGIEALVPEAGTKVMTSGPKISSGFYTLDPVMSEFIRRSIANGYTIFDYEQRKDQDVVGDLLEERSGREVAQAKNIIQILKENPAARVLLVVGGSHGAKIPQERGLKMLARLLMDELGADVLSIEQGAGTPASEKKFDTPIYQALEASLRQNQSTVFRQKGGGWLSSLGFDMTVFHGRSDELLGRGHWLALGGDRKPVTVTIEAQPQRTLLRAHALPVIGGDVAADQVLLDEAQTQAALFLPQGVYEISRDSQGGSKVRLGRLTVR